MCPFDELGLPKKWKCGCRKRDMYGKRIHECIALKGRHTVMNRYGTVIRVM